MSNLLSETTRAPLDALNQAGVLPLEPVDAGGRIPALDMLRGWAMFGVLLSNLLTWYGATEVTGVDRELGWVQGRMIDSRFYTLLVLLFGVGFGVQLLRATDRGQDLRNTYYRRCAGLLAIGVVHGSLIWGGDILTIYALAGFALVMFRSVSTRAALTAAILIWFLGDLIVREAMFFSGLQFTNFGGNDAFILAHGSWLQIQRIRFGDYTGWLGLFGLTSYVSVLATFLLGLWAVRSGYFRRVTEDRRATTRLLIVSLVAAGVGYLAQAYAGGLWPPFQAPPDFEPRFPYPYFQLSRLRALVLSFFDWETEGTTLAYAALLLLLWQRPFGARLLRPLAATGRMALTTYLTQSLVCTFLFYGYGLGWYGRVTNTGMLAITVILFGCQMAASTWWLKRFRFGPAEWLWRRMTYGTVPPLSVPSAPATPPLAAHG